MSILAMRKVEVVALRRDIDAILERLGEAGCFQLAGKVGDKAEEAETVSSARKGAASRQVPGASSPERVQAIRRNLGLDFPEQVPSGTRMPTAAEEDRLSALWEKVAGFDADWKANQDRIARTREALTEAKAFAGLELPWRSLDQLSFLAIRIGNVNLASLPGLSAQLGDKARVYPVDDEGSVVAVTTKSGRFALDGELAKSGFVPKVLTPDFAGIPAEVPAALERDLDELESRTAELESRRLALATELGAEWAVLAASFAVAEAVETTKSGLEGSEQALRLVGWMPKDRIKAIAAELRSVAGDRVAIRSASPREVETVRSGAEEVPILLKKRRFISSFERMVMSYMVPAYGSIDPTPFVAILFVFLFSIMFGDLGQGFVIFLGGLALHFEWLRSLRKLKVFAPIVIAAGAGSMVMGVLTGSFFSSEEALAPIEMVLTKFFLGHEEHRFLDILPGEETIGTIMVFFGFTLAIGVLINSLGLIFNIVDTIKRGRLGHAIFQKNGLCGAVFLWWSIGMGVRVLTNSAFGLGWWDAVALGLPILLLIFEERLAALVDRHPYHNEDGGFANGIKAFVVVIETFSYYFSMTLSFLRVGAFALSHVVLSYVTFKMGALVNDGSALGFFLEALIVVVFNIIILVLEGMVVAIQVVRLAYYEFLSKFVTQMGTLFAPFRFRFSKE